MKITKAILKKYLKDPDTCPFCNSAALRAHNNSITPDVKVLWRNVSCDACGRQWTEEFELTLIDNLIEP